jgi:hypothetical protein
VGHICVSHTPGQAGAGLPEESEKFFTLGETALINQHLWALAKNAGILC